jgi:hypothetical protein
VAQIMYTQVSKYKNHTIKKPESRKSWVSSQEHQNLYLQHSSQMWLFFQLQLSFSWFL